VIPQLYFEPDQSCYRASAPGYTLRITAGEFQVTGRDSSMLRVRFSGVNQGARLEAHNRLAGISNFFFGNDPAQWRVKVPHYDKVAVHDVYPGIDLVFYGNQGRIEYDWVVRPGADVKRIRMKIGSRGLSIRQSDPLIYQVVDGRRIPISGGFERHRGETGFRVATYDRSLPLVIDPALVYSTFLGGNGQSNIAEAVAVDRDGNAYITGYTDSRNFPVHSQLPFGFSGAVTPFVSKISPNGTLIYSTFLGGAPNDQAHGIAVDRAGNAYVVGLTGSTAFPTVNALQPKSAGGYDVFVTKISPDGSKLLYSTYLGGTGQDYGIAIAVDLAGSANVVGYTASTDFPTVNAAQPRSGGQTDVFIARISADGGALLYSTYLGGSGNDFAMSTATDFDGNAYLTGYTNSTNFPTVNALITKPAGALWDGFVAKVAPDGSVTYSTYYGGKSFNALSGDRGFCIAADIGGNAYVEGYTSSPDFPTGLKGPAGSTVQRTYVSKIDPAGSTVVYTAYIAETLVGAASQERNCGLAVDLAGNAYATGAAISANFAVTADALQGTFGGGMPGFPAYDAFLTKLSADGSSTLYSTYLGGNHIDNGTGLAVRGSDAYVTGFAWSSNFPTNDPSQSRGPFGDIFVTRIAGDGPQVASIGNDASGLAGPIAPGEWISITGSQLGPSGGAGYTANANGGVDSTLTGVQVLFDNIPGTPIYVSDSQIRVIVPYEIADRADVDVSVIISRRSRCRWRRRCGRRHPRSTLLTRAARGRPRPLMKTDRPTAWRAPRRDR
jgi:hypothetical protein